MQTANIYGLGDEQVIFRDALPAQLDARFKATESRRQFEPEKLTVE